LVWLATLALITPIESIAIAVYIGIDSGAAVIISHSLGENKIKQAWNQSKAIIIWTVIIALLISLIIFFTKDLVLSLYSGIDMETIKLARQIFIILASTTLFRAINITIVVGLLRSGGDTVFILGLDLFSQWGVGILLTYLCAFVWHQPLPVVFLAINSEEIVKFFICSYRYLSRKWLRNLVT